MRNKLEELFSARPERARELREIFEGGFDAPVARKIWKKLSCVYAAGTGSFAVYADALSGFLGDVPLRNGSLSRAEAVLGWEEEPGLYRMEKENAFLEFVPLGENPQEGALLPEETQPDKEYTLLITNHAGLYRYAMRDVVKVHSLKDGVPLFSLEYSLEQQVHLQDVVLTDKMIFTALRRAANELDLTVGDYAYQESHSNDALVVYLEPEVLMETGDERLKQLRILVDQYLQEGCEKYRMARRKGFLKGIVLFISEPETHLLYRDMERYRLRGAMDHIPPVRCINTPVKEKFFMSQSQQV